MSLPGDNSPNGESHDPPTPFRQLRAILGAASEGARSRLATRRPESHEDGAGSSGAEEDADGAAATDRAPAADLDLDTGDEAKTVAGRDAGAEQGGGNGRGNRGGNGRAKGAGGAAARSANGARDDGPAHGQPGAGPDGLPSEAAGSATLTSDDVLDLMGADGDADDDGGRNGASNRNRSGWLLPARTAPGTELDPAGDEDESDELDLPPAVKPRRLRDRSYRRRHGVAPFVQPSARRNRRKRRRDYRKLGFIELSQEKVRLRHRIFPRTVLGISAMILAAGIGAALAGATLYAYYDYRLSQNETSVETFSSGFDDVFASAISQLNGVRDQAVSSVNNSLGPLQDWQNDANTVIELPGKVGVAVWTLRTADAAGKPVVGSAFVVSSDGSSSLLLTAHELVAAATAQPGPRVTLEKGGEQLPAEVWSWDPDNDLALVKLGKGNLPAIAWAPETVRAAAVGTRVYAVSGLGGSGAKAVGGMVVDQSNVGLQHNVQLSPDFRGGPLVNAEGQVLAVATSTYRPLGFDPGPLPYAPDITAACRDQKVLVCPAALTGQR